MSRRIAPTSRIGRWGRVRVHSAPEGGFRPNEVLGSSATCAQQVEERLRLLAALDHPVRQSPAGDIGAPV